jgi:hypothetical protein
MFGTHYTLFRHLVSNMTSLFSYLTPNENAFVCLQAVSQESSRQLAFLLMFREGVTTERKNISGKILLFQNCCRTIYPKFLIFLSENDDFVRETKIVPREKIQ